MTSQIAYILPLYNKFAYGRLAAASFFRHTADGFCIVVDDASPLYPQQDWDAWLQDLPRDRILFHRFPGNGGLTRSWNWGLDEARKRQIPHTIAGNSDIIFTPGWSEPLLHLLHNSNYHLVAPVTNAPGRSDRGKQQVANYYPGFRVDDSCSYLRKVAAYLTQHRKISEVVPAHLNGFFLMAKTAVWWSGAFDNSHVFNPGKRMTGNEDELQKRWKRAGRRTGYSPRSFIFHYRAVSRGHRYKSQGWHRAQDLNREF